MHFNNFLTCLSSSSIIHPYPYPFLFIIGIEVIYLWKRRATRDSLTSYYFANPPPHYFLHRHDSYSQRDTQAKYFSSSSPHTSTFFPSNQYEDSTTKPTNRSVSLPCFLKNEQIAVLFCISSYLHMLNYAQQSKFFQPFSLLRQKTW